MVQIFPKADQDLFTFHPSDPRETRPGWFGRCPSRTGHGATRFLNPPEPLPHGGIMTKRGRLMTMVVVLVFAAFLLWSTLTSQRVECTVTIAYGGVQGVGTASAASEMDAAREAKTAACGPLAQGMNDRIACGRIPPVSTRCRNL
jgi:hypothetical protein